MSTSRRDFLGGAAAFGGLALTGCITPNTPKPEPVVGPPPPPPAKHFCNECRPGRVGLQLYSLNRWIPRQDPDKKVALAKALVKVRELGYEAVEFAGYYGANSKELKKMLADAGILACGTHVGNNMFGFNTSDVKRMKFDAGKLRETCEFELGYGNHVIICPGGGNFPGRGQKLDDFLKGLVELYNQAAGVAARYGCRIGLHNHTREFQLKMADGTTYWDYFFSHTVPLVQMQQDVGWTTCAGSDPRVQYIKYPNRSWSLHAKENGMGKNVTQFDAILGQPGKPEAVGVDWDHLFPVTDADGVKWYVVECERHQDSLDAVIPSLKFLKDKGRV